MEETPEGLAAAAATREALKRKRASEDGQKAQEPPPLKKPTRPAPSCNHEVMLPDGYDESSKALDPAVYGEWPGLDQRTEASGMCGCPSPGLCRVAVCGLGPLPQLHTGVTSVAAA